jgi:glyoxylate reductase
MMRVMGKIVVTARIPGRWRERLAGHEIVAPDGEFTRGELLSLLRDADALLPLLSVRVDEELLAAAPRLTIVANYAVGYDNVDLAACSARKVVVTNTPDVLTDATADLAMALLLAAGRRFVEADRFVRGGAWRGWAPEQLFGMDLQGATLGIVGLGRIGRAVAQRARAFGMRIVYTQPRQIDAGWLPLDELLEVADAVTLHCPLTPATRHLLGAARFARMKPTAVLVNTARGAIVDEAALAAALAAGRPGFAGLDVFEDEPRVHPELLANPRVVVLPHVGSATWGTRARMAEVAAGCIAERLAGRRPPHILNPAALGDGLLR